MASYHPASGAPSGFSKILLGPPPPGVVPNLVNPPTIISEFIIISAITSLVTTIVLSLRLYTHICIVKRVGWEDGFLVIAVLLGLITLVIGSEMGSYGYGVHAWNVPLSHFSPFLLLDFIIIVIYHHILLFVKLAILGFYYRLSPFGQFKRIVQIMMFIVVAYTIGALASFFKLCDRVSDQWNITNPHCKGNNIAWFEAAGTVNILTDFAVLLLPIPLLWNLTLPRRQKIGVAFILMTGSASCFLSIARLASLLPALKSHDVTYNTIKIGIFSHMECQIAVICACLPTLKPFFKLHFKGLFEKTSEQDDVPIAKFPAADKIDATIIEGVEKANTKPLSIMSSKEQTKVDEMV